jgi:hypothetical protein
MTAKAGLPAGASECIDIGSSVIGLRYISLVFKTLSGRYQEEVLMDTWGGEQFKDCCLIAAIFLLKMTELGI